MSESDAAGLSQSQSPAGPVGEPVPCATCRQPIDPLRATRVTMYGERFQYFCSVQCRERFDVAALTPLPQPRRRTGSVQSVEHDRENDSRSIQRQSAPLPASTAPSEAHAGKVGPPSFAQAQDGLTDIGALLLALTLFGACLSIVLALAGSSGAVQNARLLLVVAAAGTLLAEYIAGPREPTELHPVALLAAPVCSTLVAIAERVVRHPHTSGGITLAAVVMTTTTVGVWLTRRARRALDAEREALSLELNQPGHRIVGETVTEARAEDLRPGEEIVVESGEVCPADVTVTAGSARVVPWRGARMSIARGEGDVLVAGARVLEGRLRAVVGWAGLDRAWMRLTQDIHRRADLWTPLVRWSKISGERGAPVAAGLAALTAFAADYDFLTICTWAVAAQAAVAAPAVAQIGVLHVNRAVLDALRRGIAFRTADALDRAGRVSSTAFCARGTLLLGEPEVTNIEPIGPQEPTAVLALVAGAHSGVTRPAATAVLRAARARGVLPDAVRSPNVEPGFGVTAVASNGQPLIVGSRALMLREKVSIAVAEARITELEAMGRTVLLVALGGRLIGAVGMQDGLRPGARAAVQHLLDVGVEPVLLSGDARETCEALGRALGIEHIRPELLPGERGQEVRRLMDGGAIVAVVGHSPADDAALAAGDVSVALSTAGSSVADWGVQLASDDVRDAALGIRLAHSCRREAWLGLTLTLVPGIGAALAVAFGLVPPALAPIGTLGGSLLALLRFRGHA